jgi:hypothetical protein
MPIYRETLSHPHLKLLEVLNEYVTKKSEQAMKSYQIQTSVFHTLFFTYHNKKQQK